MLQSDNWFKWINFIFLKAYVIICTGFSCGGEEQKKEKDKF